MATVRFDTSEAIDREDVLRTRFGTDRIDLAPGATITMIGTITLGTEVAFAGECSLGDGTSIGNGSQLTNVVLGEENRVRPYSILSEVCAGARNLIGPFCFLRDGCVIGNSCTLGAHVEATRSRFADGVKVSHRAFIGDADMGARSIVGAGVVFCNWDGSERQTTTVGADVTLGSGTLLIPPLHVGDGAFVAAGSTVIGDVAAGARVIQKRGG